MGSRRKLQGQGGGQRFSQCTQLIEQSILLGQAAIAVNDQLVEHDRMANQ